MNISPFRIFLGGAIAVVALAALAFDSTLTDAGQPGVGVGFTVNSTADDTDAEGCQALEATSDCTFREALEAADANNNQPDVDTIAFDIPGDGPHRITRTGGSYFITEPTHVDGTTEPSFTAPTPAIILDGASTGSIGLGMISDGDGSTIEAISIVNFTQDGIQVNGADNSTFIGNYFGTDDGLSADGNGNGIRTISATGLMIGGTDESDRNLFVANTSDGISLSTSGNTIQGNYIGVGADGVTALGNGTSGIEIFEASNNLVGGDGAGEGNVISANGASFGAPAVNIGVGGASSPSLATGNQVVGNFIGTDATGQVDVGNVGAGVRVLGVNNTVGGSTAEHGNLISGNGQQGLWITGGSGNTASFNMVGVDTDGNPVLGNDLDGITAQFDTSDNVIEFNTVADNGFNGVSVSGTLSTGNRIRQNDIFANALLGIELDCCGVTDNDEDDPDSGANNLQNFPELTEVAALDTHLVVEGTLNSTPSTFFTLEFFANDTCDPSGNGEGEEFVFTRSVTTDANGDASFSYTPPSTMEPGFFLTATATDNGTTDTSEFSACKAAAASLKKCRGQNATIVGTTGADEIDGTSGDDVIIGLGGTDRINGLGGEDTICGNTDNDIINGGGGDDEIVGGMGNDTLRGGMDNDEILGRPGDDDLFGGSGVDLLGGGQGQDDLSGGPDGPDDCRGGTGGPNPEADTAKPSCELTQGIP